MKSKNKIVTIAIILTTLVLAGVAIFTAIRLYQTRNVAPTDSSAAVGPKVCQLSFTITGPTASPTATPQQCNSVCTNDNQCNTGLKCIIVNSATGAKRCRKPACPTKADCICSGTTATPTATPQQCNSVCTNDNQCNTGLKCIIVNSATGAKRCRKPACPTKADCICSGTTATPTATPQTVACNEVCNETVNPPISCEGELSCYSTSDLRGASGLCRNLDCIEETDCLCPGATEAPTPTATATATANPECNNSCTQNTDCPDGLMCNIASGETSGSCRNTSCLSETDCICPAATGTSAPIADEPELPDAGTSWPTVLGTAFGFLVILGSLLLVF